MRIEKIDIKKIRGRLRLTQEQLARELGVSFATVSRWETGRTKPSPLALKVIQLLLKGKK